MKKSKYVDTLIKLVELPQKNKPIFSGDCIIKHPHRYMDLDRPCDSGIEIDCDDCMFAKGRELSNEGLKILSK